MTSRLSFVGYEYISSASDKVRLYERSDAGLASNFPKSLWLARLLAFLAFQTEEIWTMIPILHHMMRCS